MHELSGAITARNVVRRPWEQVSLTATSHSRSCPAVVFFTNPVAYERAKLMQETRDLPKHDANIDPLFQQTDAEKASKTRLELWGEPIPDPDRPDPEPDMMALIKAVAGMVATGEFPRSNGIPHDSIGECPTSSSSSTTEPWTHPFKDRAKKWPGKNDLRIQFEEWGTPKEGGCNMYLTLT
jgi:hypothetical protein